MCGRFALTVNLNKAQEILPGLTADNEIREAFRPRYNIAPSQPVLTILNDARKELRFTSWGLIPHWAKDTAIGKKMINARAETLSDKPSFRTPFRKNRCLIVADGFYEWKKESSKAKTPYFIRMKNRQPFAFAGLWDRWVNKEDERDIILSSTIITTEPNQLVAGIHNRMPVILHPDFYELWLNPHEEPPDTLSTCLKPYNAFEMEAYRISKAINSPANDSPDCIQSLDSEILPFA